MPNDVTIFLSAAETSGDERGAQLIHALRERLPNARFVGAAGRFMAEAGCEVVADVTEHASMFAEGVFRLGYYFRMIGRLKRAIRQTRPNVHVPIDSPAINWHLAKASKKAGVPVVYYVAPQVWAWAPWRIKKVARLTDHVACILPFEEKYFRNRGVTATYVGHPVFDSLPPRPQALPDLLDAWYNGTWRVAMLAGSRAGEIRDHTLPLLEVRRAIQERWPKATCTFVAHNEDDAEALRSKCKGEWPADVPIAVGPEHEVVAHSHFAVTKSGTNTLELAHYGVPMVVFYRVNRLFRAIHRVVGRWGVPTDSYSLVNILARRRIIPEFMPWRGNVKPLKDMVLEMMDDPGSLAEARQDLLEVIKPLQVPPPKTASGNIADLICQILDDRQASNNRLAVR